MKLRDLVNEFGLEVKSAPSALDSEIAGAYVSDLLSDANNTTAIIFSDFIL